METNEILSAEEKAYIYNERLWTCINDQENLTKTETAIANTLRKMHKKLNYRTRLIELGKQEFTKVNASPRVKAQKRAEAILQLEKGYALFNSLYEKYVTEEECEDYETVLIESIDMPSQEMMLLIDAFNKNQNITEDDKPFTLSENKIDFTLIDEIEVELIREESVDEATLKNRVSYAINLDKNTSKMIMVDNGIRADARELGLNSDDIDAAAEMIANR